MTIDAIHSRAYSAQGRENHDRIFGSTYKYSQEVEGTVEVSYDQGEHFQKTMKKLFTNIEKIKKDNYAII